ncbi:MAG: DUF2095 family protein [Candidatus Bathyarchaeota archaeon]
MSLTGDEFKNKFPKLANEIEKKKKRVKIGAVRSEDRDESTKTLGGYMPDAIDFVRRCNSPEEAKEIIDFLEKRGEVSYEYATKLRIQLRVKGLRSFGSKKERDFYFKRDKD